MKIENGRRGHLVIANVFDGTAGIQGDKLTFLPNKRGTRPESVKGGMLDDKPVFLITSKDEIGPFWTSRFTELS